MRDRVPVGQLRQVLGGQAPGRGGWANAVAATSNQGALVGGEDGMIRSISLISD